MTVADQVAKTTRRGTIDLNRQKKRQDDKTTTKRKEHEQQGAAKNGYPSASKSVL